MARNLQLFFMFEADDVTDSPPRASNGGRIGPKAPMLARRSFFNVLRMPKGSLIADVSAFHL